MKKIVIEQSSKAFYGSYSGSALVGSLTGSSESFPGAELTFDKFHVVKILNDAVDEVRRQEQKKRPEFKGSRFVWKKMSASSQRCKENSANP